MTSRLRLTLVLYVITALLPVPGIAMTSERGEPLRFLAVAPGIAHATFRAHLRDTEPFSGHAFKIDLDVAELHGRRPLPSHISWPTRVRREDSDAGMP